MAELAVAAGHEAAEPGPDWVAEVAKVAKVRCQSPWRIVQVLG